MKLNKNDYKTILKFYKVDISALSSKAIKEKAEHFLAVKLCKCIKNIRRTGIAGTSTAGTSTAGTSGTGTSTAGTSGTGTKKEKRAIAVCYNSVLTKKGLKIFKFTCKKKVKLLPKKGTRKIVVEKISSIL
jgi:hypothetical protein